MNQQEIIRVFTLSNEFKEGDLLVGGTRDDLERGDARDALAALTISEITRTCFVPDQVTDSLDRGLNRQLLPNIETLSVGELKRILLSPAAASWVATYRDALTSEVIAAAIKLMSDQELGRVCRSLFNPLPGAGVTIGSPSHFGSRIQPNSPGDDEDEICMSILEGLSYGCGDVILGLNPASDDLDTIIRLEDLLRSVVERLDLPTRYCVLSDLAKQTAARAKTKVDVGFQSLAGTSNAINCMLGMDVDGLLDLARGFPALYFETGQGSAVTNGAAEGVDMVTLESRAYGVARHIQRQTGSWMIVNDVAGFIGPEVFRSAEQLFRVCLEDMAMAKLHGLTMGLDVCATFHMGIEPAVLRRLTESIVVEAAPAYLMAVAGNADPMLGYLTTSFREHPRLRQRSGKEMTSAHSARLHALGVPQGPPTTSPASLYAAYEKAGGDTRSSDELRREGERKVGQLRDRGFDLGYSPAPDGEIPKEAGARLDAIYSNARAALYATIDESVLRNSSDRWIRVSTCSLDREDYLAHPPSGERLSPESAARVFALYPVSRPPIQLVISDGLNAIAINETLAGFLPPLKKNLTASGFHVGNIDIVIDNARLRAGYQVGKLLRPEILINLIGERPGTGINTVSAYITYGKDKPGAWRWSPGLDHSATSAVCGIHPRGKPPAVAVEEIARLVSAMLKDRCSGVELYARKKDK